MFLRPNRKLKRRKIFNASSGRTEQKTFKRSDDAEWISDDSDSDVNPETSTSATCATPKTVFSDDVYISESCLGSSVGPIPRYESEKQSRIKGWIDMRGKIFDTYVGGLLCAKSCSVCCSSIKKLFRCLDCCQWESLCQECLRTRHNFPHLHIFEEWKGNTFIPLKSEAPTSPTWQISFHRCSTFYCKRMVIIDEKGRQHQRLLQFCSCEAEAVTLCRFHLWPSTSKYPTVAFTFEFLMLLRGLFIESQVSVKSFCDALIARTSPHHRQLLNQFQVQNIYKILITETYEEFRLFMYKVENPFDDDKTQCPPCYSTSRKIYCMDADFQLVRKASGGKQWTEPKHAGRFFLKQSEVDEFVNSYHSDKGNEKQECSEFQAGNNLRSKVKNKKLDETAVFGSTCRHGYPNSFFSLKHGERLSYAVFLLRHFLHGNDKKIYVLYDIACILERHLKKCDAEMLNRIIFSIPIFHSYGHNMSCQILKSPRRIQGLGLTDGEAVERLWSYLGRFSKITKETTPENRIDILVEGLIHYGSKIREKIGVMLIQKLVNATNVEKSSINALDEILRPIECVTDETVLQWIEEEKQGLSKNNSGVNETQNLLNNIKQQASERAYLLDLMKKYARGQSIALRLGKQLKIINKKIRNTLSKYNGLSSTQLTFKDVTNNTSVDEMIDHPVPQDEKSLKRKAVALRLNVSRAREEQVLIKEEMKSVCEFYEHNLELLRNRLNLTSNQSTIALIMREGLTMEKKLMNLVSCFSSYIVYEGYIPYFINMLDIKLEDIMEMYDIDDEPDDVDFDDSDDDNEVDSEIEM